MTSRKASFDSAVESIEYATEAAPWDAPATEPAVDWGAKPVLVRKRAARDGDCRHGMPGYGQDCVDCRITRMVAAARQAQQLRRLQKRLERTMAREQRAVQLTEARLGETEQFLYRLLNP